MFVELRGAPICSTRPPFMTAMRSLIVSASSWSCVTYTNVVPRAALDLLELELHLLAQLEVERAERLVQQQRGGFVDERARERDPLLLAAGELPRPALLHPLEAHRAQRIRRRACARRHGSRACTRSPKATFSNTLMCGNSA